MMERRAEGKKRGGEKRRANGRGGRSSCHFLRRTSSEAIERASERRRDGLDTFPEKKRSDKGGKK